MNKWMFIVSITMFFQLSCMEPELSIDYSSVSIAVKAIRKNDPVTIAHSLCDMNQPTKNHIFIDWVVGIENLPVVKLFLNAGADVHATNILGHTALFKAGGNVKVAQLLLDYGAVVNIANNRKTTPLHYFASSYASKISTMELLLQNGADINAQDEKGRSPLHYAVFYDDQEKVDLLITYEADLSVYDNDGKTPFDLVKNLPEQNIQQEKHSVKIIQKKEEFQKRKEKDPVVKLIQLLGSISLENNLICRGQKRLTNNILSLIKQFLLKIIA